MPGVGVSVGLMRRRPKAAAAASTDPTTIYESSLKLWLPHNDTAVTEAGTGASQLDDQSGNGHSLVQATDGNRPTYTASDADFNNKGSLTWNGTSDRMIDVGTSVSTNGSYTIWCVVKAATADAAARWIIEWQTGRLGLVWSFTGTQHGIFQSAFTPWLTSSPDTAAQALIFEFDSAGGTCRLWEGGTDRGTVSYTTTNLTGDVALGSNFAGTSNYFSGKTADIGVADGVDAAKRAELQTWLSSEYGVAA